MDFRDLTDPQYNGAVYQAVVEFLSRDGLFFYANLILVALTTVLFLMYCLSKEGRDERGRGIVGTASMCGLVVLVILINIYSQYTYTVIINPYIFSNGIRMVYNGYMLTTLTAIAILRKRR